MIMSELIDTMTKMINDKMPRGEAEYMANDGFLHCSICGDPVQKTIKILGSDRIVRIMCKCRQQELEEKARTEKVQEIERAKSVCFADTNMCKWCFENDDQKRPDITRVMKNYSDNFQEFLQEGKGIIMYGSVGTGKTYFAACVANRLIESGYDVLMTNFSKIVNQIQSSFDARKEFIESLNRYSLLIIDDLGAERKSEYMQEIVFSVIDARYRAGKPLIITTNLTADEIKKPNDVAYARIYDRILERCFPLKVDGYSRRRQAVKDTFQEMRERLGVVGA